MAVPSRRKSKSKKRTRHSSNMKIDLVESSSCNNCGEVKIPHCVCKYCGYYNSKHIVNTNKNKVHR